MQYEKYAVAAAIPMQYDRVADIVAKCQVLTNAQGQVSAVLLAMPHEQVEQ